MTPVSATYLPTHDKRSSGWNALLNVTYEAHPDFVSLEHVGGLKLKMTTQECYSHDIEHMVTYGMHEQPLQFLQNFLRTGKLADLVCPLENAITSTDYYDVAGLSGTESLSILLDSTPIPNGEDLALRAVFSVFAKDSLLAFLDDNEPMLPNGRFASAVGNTVQTFVTLYSHVLAAMPKETQLGFTHSRTVGRQPDVTSRWALLRYAACANKPELITPDGVEMLRQRLNILTKGFLL